MQKKKKRIKKEKNRKKVSLCYCLDLLIEMKKCDFAVNFLVFFFFFNCYLDNDTVGNWGKTYRIGASFAL